MIRYFILFLLLVATGFSQEIDRNPEFSKEKLQNVLNDIKYKSFVALSSEYWERSKLEDKVTGEITPIKKLSDFEQQLLIFTIGRRMSHNMKRVHSIWLEAKTTNVLNKTDLEKACVEVTKIREKFAQRYETFAETMFDTYRSRFHPSEIKQAMDELKKFHDDDKLIAR